MKGDIKKFTKFGHGVCLCIALMVGGCDSGSNFEFKEVIVRQDLGQRREIFDPLVQGAKLFAEGFVNGYRDELLNSVPPAFRDSFMLATLPHITARAVLSTTREAILQLNPGHGDTLRVEITRLPVQYMLLTGTEAEIGFDPMDQLVPEGIAWYNRLSSVVRWADNSFTMYVDIHFTVTEPKIISFGRKSMVVLVNASVVMATGDSGGRTDVFRPLSLLTGEIGFGWALPKAANSGRALVNHEIEVFYSRSDLFRQAKAHPELRVKAMAIQRKLDKAKDVPDAYPPWQRQKEIAELADEAERLGITDTTYAGKLIASLYGTLGSGTFLWYHGSHWGFMWQWCYINMAMICLFLIVWCLRRQWPIISWVLHKLRWSPYTIVIGVNGWAFYSRPDNSDVWYWLLPGLLMVVCLIVAYKTAPRFMHDSQPIE